MGPGPRFELGRKAPQASMLPSYITPATLMDVSCTSAVFLYFRPRFAWLRYCHVKHLYLRLRKILPPSLYSPVIYYSTPTARKVLPPGKMFHCINEFEVNPKFFEMSLMQNQLDKGDLLPSMETLKYVYRGSS